MGTSWIMVEPGALRYICLPKRGEWCNVAWKIWQFLQDSYGETIEIIPDHDPKYAKIRADKDYREFTEKSVDQDTIIAACRDLACGAHVGLFHYLSKKEMELIKKEREMEVK